MDNGMYVQNKHQNDDLAVRTIEAYITPCIA